MRGWSLIASTRAAWGKANGVFNQEILFLSDPGAKFSQSIGWNNGVYAARYAILLNKGEVVYAGKDDRGHFEVSHEMLRDRNRANHAIRILQQILFSRNCDQFFKIMSL